MAERLDSWKAIAAYLGRRVRTVQRWARDRGLPVHRLPGGKRPRVFALKPEIDAWLRGARGGPRQRVNSVAVLPFLNLSGDPSDQRFGDGLADDIIDALVRIPGLRVSARTSSFAAAAEGADARQIGARLGASWLLEGSVRRVGQRLRVAAQLVSAKDGYHAWSERYDRELTDLFAIQDEIAQSIATALKLKLTRPRTGAPPDLAAYDLWVRGRTTSQLFTTEAFAEARECFEAAIERDPSFARPYFGLADLLFTGAQFGTADPATVLPQARQAIARSLELDDRFGEAYAVAGVFHGILDYDWAGAEAAFQRAFELSPGSATILSRHAWFYLMPTRQIDAAVDEALQAVALDPLSPFAQGQLGLILTVAGQHNRAVTATRTAVELAPRWWWLHWFHANALVLRGSFQEGLKEGWLVYEQAHHPLVIGAMATMCGLASQRQEAQRLLAELEEIATRTNSIPPQAFALAYLGTGDDRVFEWLDRAITARDPVVTHMPFMPIYDGIRSDPRFSALLARMNLAPTTP